MLPEGFSEKMERMLGDEFGAFMAAYSRKRYVGLRINPLKGDAPPELAEFGLEPVPWAENGYYYAPDTRPGLSPLHDAGLYYLQEPSAMAPAGLLSPEPGERVLDMCAAPGGKSTQIGALMKNSGLLVSNEINPKRAKILSRNTERMGLSNVLVINEHPQRIAEKFPGYFDRVLVDAPCSGEGMFLKEEAAVSDWSQETVEMCARRQLEILLSAAEALKPGGRLVYSTCTFSQEENEGTVSAFLSRRQDMEPETVEAPWFEPGGLPGTFRLWPHKLRGEGHFAAVMRKRSGAAAAEPEKMRTSELPPELKAFCGDMGIILPEGEALEFMSSICILPEGAPDIRGLKVLRAGLETGKAIKGRFEPAHALALWLRGCDSEAGFAAGSPEIAEYLKGGVIKGDNSGWTLIKAGGVSLGWAKGSDGALKNHYPKGLRRKW